MKRIFKVMFLSLFIGFLLTGCFEDQETQKESNVFAQISCSSNISLVSNVETKVSFDTSDFDSDDLANLTDNSLIIKDPGEYVIIVNIEYSADVSVEAYTKLYKGSILIGSIGGQSYDYVVYQVNQVFLVDSIVKGDEFTLTGRAIGQDPLIGVGSTLSIYKL